MAARERCRFSLGFWRRSSDRRAFAGKANFVRPKLDACLCKPFVLSLQALIRSSLHKPTQGVTRSAMRKSWLFGLESPMLRKSSAFHPRADGGETRRAPAATREIRRGSNLPHRHCARYRTALATPVECRHTASAKKRERCRDRTLSGVQSAGINRASVFRIPR